MRLFYWQILVGDKLKAMAESQYSSKQEIPAKRGKILASDGFALATNKQAYLLYSYLPELKQDKKEISTKLAPILALENPKEEEAKILAQLTQEDLSWVPLAKKIDRQKKENIESLGIAGLGFQEEEQRFYPEGSMSAHLLGFVGQDRSGGDKGYFGLEGFYDRILSGKPGFSTKEQDATGKPIVIGRSLLEGGTIGGDLTLNIDRSLQFLLEEKLKKGIERFQASGGLAVVMDPETGAILGMASFPSYDPAEYDKTDKSLFSNPVISQTFEPGSIFKPLVMASALEAGAIKPEDKCDRCTGPRQIGEYFIRTWNDKYHPDSTMTDILVNSDNVGMVYVSEKLGKENLLSHLRDFGIGQLTDIDLEGETTASLRPDSDWATIDLATAGFGQGIAVTPIQILRAMAVIANGGNLVEPQVVNKIKLEDKEIEIKPKIAKRVISQKTARIVTEMMVASAERGGKWERPKGYRVAGKTGTAQIPIAGHYDKEKTIVSFVGFAPVLNTADSLGASAGKPRFVMLVTLREPALTWGSMTVAPLWFEIAKEIFYLFGIPPSS